MKGDYAKGRIYKIEPICEHDENEVYYGSTCQLLCKRMDSHRSDYRLWTSGKHNKTSSYELFKKYGVENCKIYLVELYPCETKEELFAREGYYIKNNKCVNKHVPGRTRKEHYEDTKEILLEQRKPYQKEYYKNHKEKHSQTNKEYREKHKDEIKEYLKVYNDEHKQEISINGKDYYKKNSEMIKQRSKNYRQKNIEKLSTKYNCECGGKYTYESKSKHLKSTKHIEWYNEQNVEEVNDV
jgi:hypothetical protein